MTGRPELLDHHHDLLMARAIDPQVAAERGYSSTVGGEGLRDAEGFSRAVARLGPGLIIPIWDAWGQRRFCQFRPDRPRIDNDGRPRKYELPYRTRLVLDVPPRVVTKLDDPGPPVFITESPLKADAGASAGLVCIGMFGVWGWRGTNSKAGTVLLPDWDKVAVNGREVFLVPDSDIRDKPQVQTATGRLGAVLDHRGADVRYVYLPHTGNGGKQGLDDYFAAGGTVDGLRELADDEPPGSPAHARVLSTPSRNRATVQPPPVEQPALASDLRILSRLAKDAVALGVVGEGNLAATVYLVLTSRLLDQQVSLAVKGHSASGKSFVVQAVVKLVPPEAVVTFTGMSEHALVYSDEEYAHRTIVLYEAEALRETAEAKTGDQTAYFLRSLLSEGRLEYPVTVKGADGDFTVRTIVKEGPTNLVLTTTRVQLHGENETRMLSLTTDDTREQTKAVMRALADENRRAVNVERWHQLQRWLAQGERRVTIPYAGTLADRIPPAAVRLRRDFGALLALVRAHALLHRASRERDADGRIIAAIDDYAVVRDLVGPVLAENAAATVSPVMRETVTVVTDLDEAAGEDGAGVTAATAAAYLKVDKSAAYRRLQAAAVAGYVENLEDRRGRPGRWRPTDAPLPSDADLLPCCSAVVASAATTGRDKAAGQSAACCDGCTVARLQEAAKSERCPR